MVFAGSGTSFSRLCANCFFYSAPMVAVVKTEEGQVLGAIISRYGNAVQLYPQHRD